MTNYFDISLQIWNEQAQKACFSLDLNQKSRAEQFFYLFIQNPNLNLIIQLINNGSDILIFILFTYINKNIVLFSKNIKHFETFVETVASWQLKKFELIHPKNGSLKNYTTKTIIMSLGCLLKHLYEMQSTCKDIIQLLTQMKGSHLKLLIMTSFIQAIETVDTQMGYMRYRSMVYSFQDNIIPLICQNLMPFFFQLQEGVRISQLSYLQQRLQVSQNGNNGNYLMISQQLSTQTQYFLMVLKKIVQFNYNITYTEYQSEQVIDTCLITFPDKVLQIIINSDFINSLFFIIDKITESQDQGISRQFLQIALKCLTKMMQSRLTYILQENKEKFIISGIKGLYHLILKCQRIGHQKLLEGVLICNKKLFINVQLCYIKKLINKMSQNDSSIDKLYQNYVIQLTKLTLFVVRNSSVNIDNFLLLQAIELTYKLIISYGYRDQEHLDEQSQIFMNYAKQTITGYLKNLLQPKYIFQTCKILSLPQNKQFINHLFDLFKKVASYNYQYFFTQIFNLLAMFSYTNNSPIVFSNFLFLLAEIIDHNYLERNLYLQKAKDKDILILSKIIKEITIKIKQFMVNKKNGNYSLEEISYIDTAIIIFTQTLLLQFITGFQGLQKIKIKKKLYNYMIYGQAFSYYFEHEDQKSQQTIIGYIQILLYYIGTPIISPEDQVKALFSLDTIEKIIFKIKWNMKRQAFTKTQIFKFLQTYFQNFFYQFKYSLDVRSRVAKIMVTLTFDDVLDQYKFRINKFLRILETQDLIVLLYDLIGVFQGIQTHAICKYFCSRLKKIVNLDIFFKEIFIMASSKNEEKLYRDICRLIKNIILNKGLKLSNCVLGYQLFRTLLPFIIILLKQINSNIQASIEMWSEPIFQILEMFSGIINSSHINIFVLDYNNQKSTNQPIQLFYTFTVQLFKILASLPQNLRMFPKLQEVYLLTMNNINKEILSYIYSDTQYILCDIYNIMTIKLIELTNSYIQLALNGNKILQDKLVKIFQCLRMFYSYFNKKKLLIHKKYQIQNLSNYITLSTNYNNVNDKQQDLILHLISFLLTNNKNNHSYLRTISKLVYQLSFHFKHHIMETFSKVCNVYQNIHKFQIVLNKAQESQESFLDGFKTFIKEIC